MPGGEQLLWRDQEIIRSNIFTKCVAFRADCGAANEEGGGTGMCGTSVRFGMGGMNESRTDWRRGSPQISLIKE